MEENEVLDYVEALPALSMRDEYAAAWRDVRICYTLLPDDRFNHTDYYSVTAAPERFRVWSNISNAGYEQFCANLRLCAAYHLHYPSLFERTRNAALISNIKRLLYKPNEQRRTSIADLIGRYWKKMSPALQQKVRGDEDHRHLIDRQRQYHQPIDWTAALKSLEYRNSHRVSIWKK